MIRKSCFIILGIALGLLTKMGIENLFPQINGTTYVACILLSLLLIVVILTIIFRLSDKLKQKIQHR